MLRELRLPFEWVGIADAEDLFHPHLLRMVDYRFRLTGAGIVQCGVQLTGFSAICGSVADRSGCKAQQPSLFALQC
jgi:hypothetical protein